MTNGIALACTSKKSVPVGFLVTLISRQTILQKDHDGILPYEMLTFKGTCREIKDVWWKFRYRRISQAFRGTFAANCWKSIVKPIVSQRARGRVQTIETLGNNISRQHKILCFHFPIFSWQHNLMFAFFIYRVNSVASTLRLIHNRNRNQQMRELRTSFRGHRTWKVRPGPYKPNSGGDRWEKIKTCTNNYFEKDKNRGTLEPFFNFKCSLWVCGLRWTGPNVQSYTKLSVTVVVISTPDCGPSKSSDARPMQS